jgi:hypothetical protein
MAPLLRWSWKTHSAGTLYPFFCAYSISAAVWLAIV